MNIDTILLQILAQVAKKPLLCNVFFIVLD